MMEVAKPQAAGDGGYCLGVQCIRAGGQKQVGVWGLVGGRRGLRPAPNGAGGGGALNRGLRGGGGQAGVDRVWGQIDNR